MSVSGFIFWSLCVIALIYIVSIYNGLVTLKHSVSKAWANIDVLLKQRHDELPKLVETCKQYMKFEQETLEKVMKARSSVASSQQQGDMSALGKAEGAMRLGLGSLFAVAEAYPELKADETFQHLQARITGLENDIADRREFFNESVNNNNVQIENFPDLFIAKWFNFSAKELLEFTVDEKEDVNLNQLFDQ